MEQNGKSPGWLTFHLIPPTSLPIVVPELHFVDVTDLGILATNWQAGVAPGSPLSAASFEQALASVGLGGASVPEPAAITLLGLLTLINRRRRRGRISARI